MSLRIHCSSVKFPTLQRLHYFQVIMEVVTWFPLCWNLGRYELQQRMSKWGEESIRCKPYFILFLNKGIACRNIRTVNTTACAAGSLPVEKLSDQLRLVLFLNPTTSKCLPWTYLWIVWFTTHCPPCLSRVIWKECVPLHWYYTLFRLYFKKEIPEIPFQGLSVGICGHADWSWAMSPGTIPCSTD